MAQAHPLASLALRCLAAIGLIATLGTIMALLIAEQIHRERERGSK